MRTYPQQINSIIPTAFFQASSMATPWLFHGKSMGFKRYTTDTIWNAYGKLKGIAVEGIRIPIVDELRHSIFYIVVPGNFSFTSKIKFMEKKETSKSAKLYKNRLKSDPSYERIRENVAEFSVAGKAARLIRNAFRSFIKGAAISSRSLVGRMQQALTLVLKADITSDRGARLVSKGDLSLLNKFDFNSKASLQAVLFSPYTAMADRATGKLTLQFPAFIPAVSLSAAFGATHFRIVTAAAELDFQKETYILNAVKSEHIPYNNTEAAAFNLELSITANTQQAFLQVLGVEFYQEVNGKMYLLKDDTRSVLGVIHAESAVV